MSQSENPKKPYFEPELKAQGKISGLTEQTSGISGGFSATVFMSTLRPTFEPE